MTTSNINPQDDELADDVLEGVAGGAETETKTTKKKKVVKKTQPSQGFDGESKDSTHNAWTDI